MKFRLSISTALLILIAALALIVNAHPGKTDSSGGHTDKSTGEYHYHHGYSAHDHYDMDGDGIRDCPYDFDDKTGQNSGSPSDSHNTSSKHPSSSSRPTRSLWTDLVDFFGSPYGIFCAIAVIIQTIFALILIFVNLQAKYFWVLLLSITILFIASIKVSGLIIVACLIAYISVVFLIYCILPMLLCIFSMICSGIQWLINSLFSQE